MSAESHGIAGPALNKNTEGTTVDFQMNSCHVLLFMQLGLEGQGLETTKNEEATKFSEHLWNRGTRTKRKHIKEMC